MDLIESPRDNNSLMIIFLIIKSISSFLFAIDTSVDGKKRLVSLRRQKCFNGTT